MPDRVGEPADPDTSADTDSPILVRVPLDAVPDGLVALAVARADGTLPRDRKGRSTPRRVALLAIGEPRSEPSEDTAVMSQSDWRWITLATTRRWETVAARLGSTAWPMVLALARDGIVAVECTVDGVRLGAPVAIRLTEPWAAWSVARRVSRSAAISLLRNQAAVIAAEVGKIDAALAEALRTARGHEKTLPVLIAAAEDLIAGAVHDGPRAFSQAHFGSTKVREDTPAVLAAAGVQPETLAALGLTRSPYLGLGGAIVAEAGTSSVHLRDFAAPVRFRVDAGTAMLGVRLQPADGTVALVVVENLQAAEAVCDWNRDSIAVVWCAGQPAAAPLQLIARLATRAARVLVAPDADFGGVRIASRIIASLPPGLEVAIADAGTGRHERREPFSSLTSEGLRLVEVGASDERVRAFAAIVRRRGYPVEQEASVREVLGAAFGQGAVVSRPDR